MERFQYCCWHNTDNGYVIDDFSLFANILDETEDTVTFQRYHQFGQMKSKKPVTVSKSDFNHYYKPITDEIFARCCITAAEWENKQRIRRMQ